MPISKREVVIEERSFVICILAKCYCRDEIEGDELGRTCITNGRDENTNIILYIILNGKTSLGKSRLKLENNVKVANKVQGIHLNHNREQRRVLVSTIELRLLWGPLHVIVS
jgi:hypothetical protein